jgi:hypothetical protein
MRDAAAALPRRFRSGERLARLGVLLAREPSDAAAICGLRVRVDGDAIARGLVLPARARARPFSARLSPWEGAGWEHSLARRGDALACVLRAAHIGRERGRGALAHAVHVDLEGRAMRAGEGELVLSVEPVGNAGGRVDERFAVRVCAGPASEVVTAYVAWPGPLDAASERAMARTVARWARVIGALPAGARVMVARGTAPERLWLREGCVVLGGAPAVAGDARWAALFARARRGALERLVIERPGGARSADDTLDLVVRHGARFGPGPVEMALSLGRARLPDEPRRVSRVMARLAAAVDDADAAYGFVAEHEWVPALLDHTPWERDAGREPARTLAAIARGERIDAAQARFVTAGVAP